MNSNSIVNKITLISKLYWLILLLSIVLFLFFQNSLTVLFSLPTYLDEIIQGFMLASIFFGVFNSQYSNSCKKILKIYVSLTMVMFLLSIEAFSHRGYGNVLQQVFVHSKFVIYVSFLAVFVEPKWIKKIIHSLFVISVCFLFFDLIKPGYLNALLDQTVQIRGGVPRPIGIQGHTGTLGFFMSLAAAFYISSFEKVSQQVKYFIFFIMAILVVITTVRTALVVFPIILLWWFKDSFQKSLGIILIIGTLALIIGSNKYTDELVSITEQNIEMSIEDPTKNAYIRGMMLFFSFELANDRFPFGTGASTFGTVKSDDSVIYAELGVQNSRFFIEKDGIYDSNFASILGEFGYLGAFFYYSVFIYLSIYIVKLNGLKTSNEFHFVILFTMLLYSFTNPIFMNTFQIFTYGLFLNAARTIESTSTPTTEENEI
jgi:hypothetical protein